MSVQKGLLVTALALVVAAPTFAQSNPTRFALVVGHNASLDSDIAPLSYADDDAAKTFELLQAAGVEVALFTVLDRDSQRRYPGAARVAQTPTRAAVMAGANMLFEHMRSARAQGKEVHFYFVYSGHGNVGPNHEGYINLHDARLRRSELYRELVAPSPATFNHLIIDACHADLLLRKRGAVVERVGQHESAAREFLQAEDLNNYPNTGVLFATSSSSETHEWSQWESGVFSHELRSAFMGAADVNGDGAITYGEAGAFVDAANSAIDVPQARLRVWSHPPAARVDAALFEVRALSKEASVLIGDRQAGKRYHVEDSRGVRIADFHPSTEQNTQVALVGAAPFFLRYADQEAKIVTASSVEVAALSFEPVSANRRGSAEASFRRHLFEVPFGLGFYRGAVSSGRLEMWSEATVVREVEPGAKGTVLRKWAVGSLIAGSVVAVGAGASFGAAAMTYGKYQQASDLLEARRLRQLTERWNVAAAACAVGAGVMLLGSGALFWLDGRKASATSSGLSMGVGLGNESFQVSISGSF